MVRPEELLEVRPSAIPDVGSTVRWAAGTVGLCSALWVWEEFFTSEGWSKAEQLSIDLRNGVFGLVLFVLIASSRPFFIPNPSGSRTWLRLALASSVVSWWVPPFPEVLGSDSVHIHTTGAIASTFLARYLFPAIRIPRSKLKASNPILRLIALAVVVGATSSSLGVIVEVLELGLAERSDDPKDIQDTNIDLTVNLLASVMFAGILLLVPRGWKLTSHTWVDFLVDATE